MSPLLMVLLLGMSGCVSGSETAIFSLQPAERRRLAGRSRVLATMLGQPTRMLVSLLFANLLINVAYFALASSWSIRLAEDGRGGAATAVVAGSLLGLVVFGEILPKTLALIGRVGLVSRMAPVLMTLTVVLGPVAALGGAVTRLLERLLLRNAEPRETVGTEDFKTALSSGAALGTYHAVELALLHDVVVFGVRRAREVMTPRIDVAFLDLADSRAQWVDAMAAHPHAEYPVIEASVDNLLGTVNGARFLTDGQGDRRALVEPPLLAPQGISAERLVERMHREQARLAILLDEFGGVEGVVGLPELSRAVLGDVEPSVGEGHHLQRTRSGLVAQGHCPLHVLREELGVEVPVRRAQTLTGAMAEALGRLPRRGDELAVPGWRMRVVTARRGRADRVLLRQSTGAPLEDGA